MPGKRVASSVISTLLGLKAAWIWLGQWSTSNKEMLARKSRRGCNRQAVYIMLRCIAQITSSFYADANVRSVSVRFAFRRGLTRIKLPTRDVMRWTFRRKEPDGPIVSSKSLPLKAISRTMQAIIVVNGIAAAQNVHCFPDIFLISETFIPKKPVMNDNGRKIVVMIVKIRIAFPWSSSRISTLRFT